MSHFTQCQTEIRDLPCLVQALEAEGFKPEVHETPQTLYGYHGDPRPQKAEVIVRRKQIGSASNDLGFVKNAGGTFDAIISDYDRSRFNDAWLKRLTQQYGLAKAEKTAIERGYRVLEKTVNKQGEPQLVLQRV